jgi:hypothetical protein
VPDVHLGALERQADYLFDFLRDAFAPALSDRTHHRSPRDAGAPAGQRRTRVARDILAIAARRTR